METGGEQGCRILGNVREVKSKRRKEFKREKGGSVSRQWTTLRTAKFVKLRNVAWGIFRNVRKDVLTVTKGLRKSARRSGAPRLEFMGSTWGEWSSEKNGLKLENPL
jgi:hypothetical protein